MVKGKLLICGVNYSTGNDKLLAVKEILDNNSIEDLNNIKAVLRKFPADKYDKLKYLINDSTITDTSIKDGETPLGEDDEKDIVVVPKTYEIEVESYDGRIQRITTDQEQYAGLSA